MTATLTPPAGSVFGDGVRRTIIVPVQILDPDGAKVLITTIDAWISNHIAIAVPVDDPIESVANHVDLDDLRIKGKDENGATQKSTVKWEFSTVDMDAPGLYHITGELKPPSGLAFAPELTLPEPTGSVSVQISGSPDINSYSRGRGELRFPWVLTKETGQYTILEKAAPTAASPDAAKQSEPIATPILPVILLISCLLAFGGGIWMRKRRAVK